MLGRGASTGRRGLGMDELEQAMRERDAALTALDMDYARRLMPDASSDEVRLAAMHKARYETTTMARELHHASGAWLRAHGYERYGGLPLLPEGELPA